MNKREGIALILALMVMSTMLILGSALFSRSIPEGSASKRVIQSTQAFWLAEAGIQEAGFALSNGNWTGWADQGSDDKTRSVSLSSGNYSVIVRNVTSDNPVAVSTGTIAGVSRQIESTISKSGNSVFTGSLCSKANLIIDGNSSTDSYDSTQGAYGGSNVGSKGNLNTTSTSANAVQISGNVNIKGNVSTGPGGTVSITQNGKVTGSITQDSNYVMNSITVPVGLSGLASSGSYTVGGTANETITPGDYKFSSLSVEGSAHLTVSGLVRIYLTGNPSFNISENADLVVAPGGKLIIYSDGSCNISGNGLVNNTNLPKNFQLYSTYVNPGTGVILSGNTGLYGVIYAPDTKIELSGNFDVFGSVVGNEISLLDNKNIHYDEALKVQGSTEQTGSSGFHYGTKEWKEQSNPYPFN